MGKLKFWQHTPSKPFLKWVLAQTDEESVIKCVSVLRKGVLSEADTQRLVRYILKIVEVPRLHDYIYSSKEKTVKRSYNGVYVLKNGRKGYAFIHTSHGPKATPQAYLDVWSGYAYQTTGGLTKSDLMVSEQSGLPRGGRQGEGGMGTVVSKRRSKTTQSRQKKSRPHYRKEISY